MQSFCDSYVWPQENGAIEEEVGDAVVVALFPNRQYLLCVSVCVAWCGVCVYVCVCACIVCARARVCVYDMRCDDL